MGQAQSIVGFTSSCSASSSASGMNMFAVQPCLSSGTTHAHAAYVTVVPSRSDQVSGREAGGEGGAVLTTIPSTLEGSPATTSDKTTAPSSSSSSSSSSDQQTGAGGAAGAGVVGFPFGSSSKETDYLELPQPVRYEELQKECLMSLRPETFEGMRFDFTKPLNQSFSLSHALQMGHAEMPTQNPNQIVKVPVSSYEFGANLIGNKGMMIGRMLTDGRMSGRVKYDVNDLLSFKIQAQLAEEKAYSQTMFDVDVKGLDWNGQVKVGNNQFVGVNYFQSVTNNLALGGEAFYLGSQRKSGVGFALRHQGEPGIATCQIATTGLLSCTYHHKVSEKVYLASELMWNWNAREATAAFGYDYILRQCRLRGRVDSQGVITAYLEERLNVGVNFVLSAELDHWRKDYRFGFGMTVGME